MTSSPNAAHMSLSHHGDALSVFEEVPLLLEFAPHERLEATCLASLSEAHAFLEDDEVWNFLLQLGGGGKGKEGSGSGRQSESGA